MSARGLSVIIPAYEREDLLAICLQRLALSSHAPDEVIVVDDASTVPLQPLVEKYGYRYHRLEKNSGPSVARNAGAQLATHELLVFLDSDMGVRPETIASFASAFGQDENLVIAQGVNGYYPLIHSWGARLVAAKDNYQCRKQSGASSFIHSQLFAIRREVFLASGGFHPLLKPPGGGEEFELGHRLRKKYAIRTIPAIEGDHFFPEIWPRGVQLFHRASAWAGLFSQSQKFESGAASMEEAFLGLSSFLCLLSGAAAFIFPVFAWLAAAFFLCSLCLSSSFLAHCWRRENFFLLPVFFGSSCLLSIFSGFGGAWGLFNLFIKNTYRTIYSFRFLFNSLPSQVVLFVTARCNAKCGHCFYWKEIQNADPAKELSLQELEKVSRGFGHIKHLSLTGGEPTLRKDLPEIAALFCRQNRVGHITVHTNGSDPTRIVGLATRMAQENTETEINFDISIDGLQETHDKLRGIDGLFARCQETIDKLIQVKELFPNLTVSVNACFNKQNQHEIKSLMDFFSTKNIDGFYVNLVRGKIRDPLLQKIDTRKYREIIQQLEAKALKNPARSLFPLDSLKKALVLLAPELAVETLEKGKTVYPCSAGKGIVVISELGEVSPCEMLSKSFGNLRANHYRIRDLLKSRHGKGLRAYIQNRNCACTWESAQLNSIIFNWRAYPRFLAKFFQMRSGRTAN